MADASRTDKDDELFERRTIELAKRAANGAPCVGEFMSPRDINRARAILDRAGYGGVYAFVGGYDGAERARLVCVPDYMICDGATAAEAAEALAAEATSAVRVDGSGYRTLSHRDFMGAILALGIKRSVVGDIIVDDGAHGAYVVADAKIADFIAENLTKIGADTVKSSVSPLPDGFSCARRTEAISDTVASMRADCVVAALMRISRERAKSMIESGLVEVNYETEYKPDSALGDGDIVSARGFGKFRIVGTDGVSRRGRLRLRAEKYI